MTLIIKEEEKRSCNCAACDHAANAKHKAFADARETLIRIAKNSRAPGGCLTDLWDAIDALEAAETAYTLTQNKP